MEEAPSCVDFDRQFNEIDRAYSGFARACGISDCAFWMLMDTATNGGEVAVSWLTSEWYYSKQTINSALKTLTARNMVELDFAVGSRKNKIVRLTAEGRAYSERYVLPALKAENRAFEALEPAERTELMRILGKFSAALGNEVELFAEHVKANEADKE